MIDSCSECATYQKLTRQNWWIWWYSQSKTSVKVNLNINQFKQKQLAMKKLWEYKSETAEDEVSPRSTEPKNIIQDLQHTHTQKIHRIRLCRPWVMISHRAAWYVWSTWTRQLWWGRFHDQFLRKPPIFCLFGVFWIKEVALNRLV